MYVDLKKKEKAEIEAAMEAEQAAKKKREEADQHFCETVNYGWPRSYHTPEYFQYKAWEVFARHLYWARIATEKKYGIWKCWWCKTWQGLRQEKSDSTSCSKCDSYKSTFTPEPESPRMQPGM